MARHPRSRIGRPPAMFRRRAIPVATTMIASMAPLLPLVATVPLVPPLGLMSFLAWRALHRNIWPAWAGLPLGLWDDLFSGAHMGTAMVLWTVGLLGLDMLDRRLIWRDAAQEWAIAAGLIAGFLLLGREIGGAGGNWYGLLLLIPQMAVAMLLFPSMMRLCDRIDQWRLQL